MKFTEIELKKDLLSAIKRAGYETMTPIQERAIPAVIEGHDMIAVAQTGTGKTAAFALPILNYLEPKKKRVPRALVLTPTRELAQQIYENFRKYGRYLDLKVAVVYGGASQLKQIQALERGYDILIATPGRLMDFADRDIIHLNHIEIFVLDEADRMLDMGFIPDVRKIEKMIPKEHQTLMFSATMAKEIEKLAKDLLKNPVDIRVAATSSPADTVNQKICFVDVDNKTAVLADYLKQEEVEKSIVFTRTKYGADKLVKALAKEGITAVAVHGNKTQGQRKDALDRFRVGRIKVLVATDVASRGIDIPKITHVFNYDLPEEAESYIHRIGRAGRAGEEGEAITICSEHELGLLRSIERLMKKEIPEIINDWTVEIDRKKKVKGPARRKNERSGRGEGRRTSGEGRGEGRHASKIKFEEEREAKAGREERKPREERKMRKECEERKMRKERKERKPREKHAGQWTKYAEKHQGRQAEVHQEKPKKLKRNGRPFRREKPLGKQAARVVDGRGGYSKGY